MSAWERGNDRTVHEVDLAPRSTSGFRNVLVPSDLYRLDHAIAELGRCLQNRRLWHVNSTTTGGGVAEMLSSLLPYAADARIDVHWLVLDCDDDFFQLTKRLHNRLHDDEGDGGSLGQAERERYERSLAAEGAALEELVKPGDVVVLHDPQTAGLAGAAASSGAHVIWRCHIGADSPGHKAREAWRFLEPDLESASAVVFSRAAHVWDGIPCERVVIIPPCIDVLSAKNHPLKERDRTAVLEASLVLADGVDCASLPIQRRTGEPIAVRRKVSITQAAPLPPDGRWIVQVSRWDRLKDPCGVIFGFASAAPSVDDAHLVLAGPEVDAVGDDPEGAAIMRSARDTWTTLEPSVRERVHLVSIPMEDPEENAAVVNALQHRADVVVQKSLAEGFGLTVAEAMWKSRPVLASRVGGIQDQIVDGESGVLLDPTDLDGFGKALARLLEDPKRSSSLGHAAHRRVCDRYLPLHHFENEARLVRRVLDGRH